MICRLFSSFFKWELLWSDRGANPPFYSTQSSHDTSSSVKNKMSLPTPNQNEKYPNPHSITRDPRPRKTRQTHAGRGSGPTLVVTRLRTAVTRLRTRHDQSKFASKLDSNVSKIVSNASNLVYNASKPVFGFKSKT